MEAMKAAFLSRTLDPGITFVPPSGGSSGRQPKTDSNRLLSAAGRERTVADLPPRFWALGWNGGEVGRSVGFAGGDLAVAVLDDLVGLPVANLDDLLASP